jgi:hypothetical protein
MTKIRLIKGRLKTVIPLHVHPHHHTSSPTITASATSEHAGTVLYGSFNMDYLLQGGDRLRLLANHDKNKVQILLLTQDPEKLRHLPGERRASMVANAISLLDRYRIRSNSYAQPRTGIQLAKYKLATTCIETMQNLLAEERALTPDDWEGQEKLRQDLMDLIETCGDGNRLLVARNPVVTEGELGYILYDIRQYAHHYQFNRAYAVSRLDQLDFSEHARENKDSPPCYVWDSELHIGDNDEALTNALKVICQQYNLNPGSSLSNIPANRFKRLELFFINLWKNSQDLIKHLASPKNPEQTSETNKQVGGVSITKIKPYYHLEGLAQVGYHRLDDLVSTLVGTEFEARRPCESLEEAMHQLTTLANGNWLKLPGNQILVRLHNDMVTINYFEKDGCYYPLPTGDDLFSLSQLAKGPLFLTERIGLQFKAFLSRLPAFFIYLYQSITHFISYDLYDDFLEHVHAGHDHSNQNPIRENNTLTKKTSIEHFHMSLQKILKNHGFLANGQTLEEFIETQLQENNYIIAREQHPPSPKAYDNPLHRSLGVIRHVAAYFVDRSERDPIIGTLALLGYFYGAGAVFAPTVLASILTKLHLNGLIAGIEPTQAFGRLMSHGTFAESISVATTYWHGMILAGSPDQFFIRAVDVLKDNPAEVAIVISLAIGMGWGLCQAIPGLQAEMGEFPYINYAFLGAKQGIAINDTLKNPGDDWLIGTIKWGLRGVLIVSKLLISPLVESHYYGFKGFLSGLKKSGWLIIRSAKQILAALADLSLALLTIPLHEMAAQFIHVPFRGLMNILSKTLAILGNWQPLGEALLDFATRPGKWNFLSGMCFSPLYGFNFPFGDYSPNRIINTLLNLGIFTLLLPFQIAKNLIILPATDLLIFTLRILLCVLNPISRLGAYILGSVLTTSASIWDNSLGLIFSSAATIVTLSANWIDNLAGYFKNKLIAEIEILRRKIYHWAFNEEDLKLHGINNDKQYFFDNPLRTEHLPHEDGSTSCILEALLSNRIPSLTNNSKNHLHHVPLFSANSFEISENNSLSDQRGFIL